MPLQSGWIQYPLEKDRKYLYLFTKQEEHKAYHNIVLLFVLLQERIYVVNIYLNLICLGDFMCYINVLSYT